MIISLFLYLASLVFINYLTVGQQNLSSPAIWSALFWIVLLSTLVNAIAKSFMMEKAGATTYLYSLADPGQIILSRVLYGFLLCIAICFAGFVFFSTFLSNPVEDIGLFIFTLVLAAFGFSASLSILSAIASKTNNGSVVMAILSFPVIIGILLMVIKVTRNCIDGLDRSASFDELLTLAAINLMISAVSYLLFPYIWRS